jgi:dTDP-glucose pyrophosphorylase
MITVVVPMAGTSIFFPKEDYPFPKPLVEVAGKTMIERVVENLNLLDKEVHFVFIISQEDIAKFSLDATLKLVTDNRCSIVSLSKPTKGALCSCLMAIEHLDDTAPVVIANGDQIIDINLSKVVQEFQSKGSDAGVITFESVHPRWSYVIVNEDKCAVRLAEKNVISKTAIAGFYYFASGEIFFNAAKASIMKGDDISGAYYVAPSINQLILEGRKVSTKSIEKESYHSFFSPAKVNEFEDWLLGKSITSLSDVNSVSQELTIVIPAAGEGSRFQLAGYEKRKPFIPVMNKPMITYVLDNLRTFNSKPVILFRKEHIENEPQVRKELEQDGCTVVEVESLTEGTACTVLQARRYFDNDSPLMVANSDQYVDFNCGEFVQDCLDRGLDGSILVFKDPDMNPKWSFARLDSSGIVQEVAEKKAISDLATVGIYFFRKGKEFVKAAIDMIAVNERVNNEFYTCPVYNYMIKQGLKIGVYEIPKDAMHGLGTPDDLNVFLNKITEK